MFEKKSNKTLLILLIITGLLLLLVFGLYPALVRRSCFNNTRTKPEEMAKGEVYNESYENQKYLNCVRGFGLSN